jgi:hypothetical protein
MNESVSGNSWLYDRRIWSGSFVGSGSSTTTSLVPYTRVRSGSVVDNYRYKIAHGQDATSAYQRSDKRLLRYTPTNIYAYWRTRPPATFQDYSSWSNIGHAYVSSTTALSLSAVAADLAARRKMVNAILRAQRSLQGGVVLGEIGKTLKMILSPASALRRSLGDYVELAGRRAASSLRASKKLRAGRARATSQVVKSIQGTYLESVFGWAPFISDIEGGVEAFNRIISADFLPVRRVSAAFKDLSHQVIDDAVIAGVASMYACSASRFHTSEVGVRYFGGLRLNLPGAQRNAELLGFKPRDFAPTLWELLPWSFLSDYFINIGDILDAYSVGSANIAWLGKTTRRVVTSYSVARNATDAFPANATARYLRTTAGTGIYVDTEFSRTALSIGDLVPPLSFSLLKMTSVRRQLNIAALIGQSSSVTKMIERVLKSF